jgi:hypothetical protein
MAGTLTLSTLSDGTNSTSATNPILGSAKAWVSFNGGNGNTAGSINSSFNVSSVTYNSTGTYTANLTNAMANTNYAPIVTGVRATTLNGDVNFAADALVSSTTAISISTKSTSSSPVDWYKVYLSVFAN